MSELKTFRPYAVAALLIVGALVCGCGNNKVTKANHDKLKTGMTLADVEAILGPAGEDADDPVLLTIQETEEERDAMQVSSWVGSGFGSVPGLLGSLAVPRGTVRDHDAVPPEAVWKKWVVSGKAEKMIAVAFVNGKAVAKAQMGL